MLKFRGGFSTHRLLDAAQSKIVLEKADCEACVSHEPCAKLGQNIQSQYSAGRAR